MGDTPGYHRGQHAGLTRTTGWADGCNRGTREAVLVIFAPGKDLSSEMDTTSFAGQGRSAGHVKSRPCHGCGVLGRKTLDAGLRILCGHDRVRSEREGKELWGSSQRQCSDVIYTTWRQSFVAVAGGVC